MKPNKVAITAWLAGVVDLTAALAAAQCDADDCLRALRATQTPGRLQSAQAFCATYTAAGAGTISTAAVPSFAAENCKDSANGPMTVRVSSACACIAPAAATGVTPTQTTTPTGTETQQPCARVRATWLAQINQNGNTTKPQPVPTVAAALAHECLKSVPLGKKEALELVRDIEPYLEWQSDAAYKKDPPKTYFYPGYDMFAELAKVKANLESDKYSTEFEFQTDLYKKVFAPGQDGHFTFYPDLLSKAFRFRRQPYALVSISEDGASLPVIKLQSEVLANATTARTITKINGIDASKFIEDTVNAASGLQDADAAYNSMFWSRSTATHKGLGGFVSGGRSAFLYHGPNTTFTFANGSSLEFENIAAIVGDMRNISDGRSMYEMFCRPKLPPGKPPPGPPSPGPPPPGAPGQGRPEGYPMPVIATKDGVVTGYFLEGKGFEDVAVLSLASFVPRLPAEFQGVVQTFLRESHAAGKKKLVVDLQNNGGGLILLGYDLFRQLFPRIVQGGNSRWKQNKAFKVLSRLVSDLVKNVDLTKEANPALVQLYENWHNYRFDLNITNQNFLTFEDKFNPHVFKDTEYTALTRWNLSDPSLTKNRTSGVGIEISGYGSRANLTQYFQPEDIIMLYDGACSSTCTLASEFLRHLGKVKTVAMGGRPKAGPIQGVGGIKGSQVLQYGDIFGLIDLVSRKSNDTAVKAELKRYTPLPILRSSAAAVNTRDEIQEANVNDGLPAQYVYEAADCRLYWTAPMISDVSEVWKAAAHAAFNGGKCAAGSIPGSSPARRSIAAPAPRPAPAMRMSKTFDMSALPVHDQAWEALHMQKAID